MRVWLALLAGLALVWFTGCARSPSGGSPTPAQRQATFEITVAGNYNSNYYYFAALDFDQDVHTGPLPVVAGPYWGNGWGTGAISHFVETLGNFINLYDTRVLLTLEDDTDWLSDATGSPDRKASGLYDLQVTAIAYGAVTVTSPDNLITAAVNTGWQSAGTFTFTTDASGNIVAGTVSFTPAALGGRALTASEQANLSAINAGGPLTANTFSAFHLTLTLGAGPFTGGVQQLVVAPAIGTVRSKLSFPALAYSVETQGTVYANSTTSTATPPIPGVTLTTHDLNTTQTARLRAQFSPQGENPRPPLASTPPNGTNHLRFTVDLEALAPLAQRMEVNFIFTDKTPLDPSFNDTRYFDALGPNGNDFVSLDITRNDLYHNSDADVPEQAGDCGLADLDITDWSIQVEVQD